MAHAKFSPSGAHGWMNCARWEESDASSEFAAEGTAAHEVAAAAFEQCVDAAAFIGQTVEADGFEFTVDADMAAHVQSYLDVVREYARAVDGATFVEQRVDFSERIGQPDAFGTSDAIIISSCGREITCVDLKFGRGVKVDADENEQLMLYALGALDQFGLAYDFTCVRLVIHQPRLGHLSEWGCTIEELEAFGERARAAAALFAEGGDYSPAERTCRWCAKKADCPALAELVHSEAIDDLVDLTEAEPDTLGRKMALVDLVEGWCKAVRAEAERRLLAGQPVDGFKLVEGRRGPRAWADPETAEETLKAMRLKQDVMYDFKLISPTTAEKLAKSGAIGPRQWPRIQELITQSPGKPHVAPADDRRSAINPADDLADLTLETEGN